MIGLIIFICVILYLAIFVGIAYLIKREKDKNKLRKLQIEKLEKEKKENEKNKNEK